MQRRKARYGSHKHSKDAQRGIDGSRQGFSNIDEDNTTLAPAVAGLTFTSGGSMLFAGIRNMNEDYFTSHFMSLFTNSSCGIFPTISANYRIANYPLASMGIHLERKIRELTIMASVYNGVGYKSFRAVRMFSGFVLNPTDCFQYYP